MNLGPRPNNKCVTLRGVWECSDFNSCIQFNKYNLEENIFGLLYTQLAFLNFGMVFLTAMKIRRLVIARCSHPLVLIQFNVTSKVELGGVSQKWTKSDKGMGKGAPSLAVP